MSAQPIPMSTTFSRDELTEILRDYMAVADRLRVTHETLQTEVERLRAEVETKDRELERRRRLSALGELAAGVAHEVRNPLGAIQLFAGLLRRECADAARPIELLDKIDGAIRSIDSVVQDTLALAPRNGEHLPIAVSQLIDRAAEMCQPVLDRQQVRLNLDVTIDARMGEPVVAVDPRSMQRVLINLISNAAEASPTGATVAISAKADAQDVTIRVSDAGPGMSQDVLDRVFDPFFTTKAQGTGLGLSIAHRVVEAHGGRISAANQPQGGAEFSVLLPKA
ncbi:MAG: sensor histidine kinase [Phycisphaerae bacterium]